MMRALKIWLVVVLALLIVAGCSKRRSAPIVHHPDWEYQDYQRVAVLPFKAGQPAAAEAARQAGFLLEHQLTESGAFTILTRSDLADVLTEQDLSRLTDVTDPDTALPEGMVQVAQAVVIGTITEFDLKRELVQRRIPRYAHDKKGRIIRNRRGQPIVTGEDVYTEHRHVARVGGNLRVIDAATGRVLLSHSVPAIERDDFQRGAPPRATPEELAVEVALEIATDFYRKIAPQRIKVKLSSKCLVVAAEYYEGKYDKLKKVPVTMDEILLVAHRLPPECDRNSFRLAISPEEGHEYLIEHEFTWSPSLGNRGEVIHVPLSVLKDSGYQKFTAKLFSVGHDEPILERDFKLVEPEEEDD